MPLSDDQLRANRANAQHSTGPTSAAGQAASSQNARTHGLRSNHLHHYSLEEEKQFRAWCAELRACLLPGNAIEEELFRQMTIRGWKARQGEALYTACYRLTIMDTINGHFEAQGENRLSLEIPGATPAEAAAAADQDPQLATSIYVLGMRRRPSILTIQRMINSHQSAFHRYRKELQRLLAQRQMIEKKSPPEPARTNPIPAPQVGRNTPCPCGSGLKFKRCCLNKPPVGQAFEPAAGF